MTTAMLDRIAVEAYLPPPDAIGFHLDADRLGTGRLGDTEADWVHVTEQLRDVTIHRGATPDKLEVSPDVGTVNLTFIDPGPIPWKPNTPVRITGDGSRLFTGRVLDINTIELRKSPSSEPREITTVTAVDRVADIANTMRYGAYLTPDEETPWATFETAAERYTRYLRPTGWDWEGPQVYVSSWTQMPRYSLGAISPAEGSLSEIPASATEPALLRYALFSDPPALGFRAEHTYWNLPANSEITVTAWARSIGTDRTEALNGWPLPADGSWTRVVIHATTTQSGYLTVQFVPTGRNENSVIDITGITLSSEHCPPWLVQNIVYESNLANHLALTANTTRGAWWVDAHNVIQTRTCQHLDADQTPLHFTDGSAPGEHSYVDLSISYSTATIVNDLQFENHGRVYDPEGGSYVADDTTIRAGRDETSIATFGARAEALPTAHPISPPALDEIVNAQIAYTADEYLSQTANPGFTPRSIRVYNDPLNSPPVLDVRAPLDVTRQGTTYPCLVVGVKHGATAQRWHTDYTLIPRT